MTDCHFLFQSEARISIVIPAYNEEQRILPLLQKLGSLRTPAEEIELIVVDDGSSDRTSDLCRQEISNQFPKGKLIMLESNSGKGSALRAGIAAVSSPVVITMDADMATDLSAMEPALRGLQAHHIVVGSRTIEGSETQGISSIRKCITTGFSLFLRFLTRYKISDTQCGFKAYRSPVAKALFSSSRVKGFAQDAEILDLGHRHDCSILEIPVRWTSVPGSKVNLVRDSLSSFLEFIWYRLNSGRRKLIYGISLLKNGTEGIEDEKGIFEFFPPESIYIRCGSKIEILMPDIARSEIEKIAEAVYTKFPDCEAHICSRTLRDLASIKN
ncbi:MAG: glycosyltransferase [Acidimicrobiales bacterium]|nr:glycosyltransferase [Acidimicrobiales bacterium]